MRQRTLLRRCCCSRLTRRPDAIDARRDRAGRGATAGRRATASAGLYAHLPFCRRRCYYCDFPVVVAGDDVKEDRVAHYITLLERELAAQPPSSKKLETVYLGGGTPSLVDPRFIKQLLDAIHEKHGISSKAEITLECDPGTFDERKLQAYVDAGVTRVSLGCQSFDDEALAAAGRAHRRCDALCCGG